jgi:Zn-dependent peptidase ImmA (M78 family)
MLDALVRDVRARQQLVGEILEDEEEAVELPFVASVSKSSPPQAVADAIRHAIRFPLDAQERCGTPEQLFRQLRSAAEQAGVYVLVLGDLGSPQSDISEQVFRGFAIADSFAPFVVINDNDAAAGRSFTLVHELAHILVGSSGVSGPLRRTSQNPIERLCNDAASYFLLPPGALEAIAQSAKGADAGQADQLSGSIAERWNVSQAVVVYRFVRSGGANTRSASDRSVIRTRPVPAITTSGAPWLAHAC